MGNVDPESNRLYARAEDLHPLHWEALARRDASEAAEAAGAARDAGAFLLPFLGRTLRVDPIGRAVRFEDVPAGEVGYQRALIAVAYLGNALAAPPSGRWVTFRELPGGDGFFRGPHSVATAKVEAAFGDLSTHLVDAGSRLGGSPCEGADEAVELPALPKIPLRVLLWRRTEEFPPRASLLVDARAHLHLALDVLWALSNVAISDLVSSTP